MSQYKKRLKRKRHRERARARGAVKQTSIFERIDNHMDDLIGPRVPSEVLEKALVSKN